MLNLLILIAYPIVGRVAPLSELFEEAQLVWFVGVPILLFLIAGIKLQMKVDRYETSKLDLIFDQSKYPTCKLQLDDDSGGIKCRRTIFRLGIISKGKFTIDGVSIKLTDIKPEILTCGPITLQPVRFAQGDFELSFAVNPGEIPTKYIELLYHDSDDGIVTIEHDNDYNHPIRVSLPSQSKNGEYILTLLAQGQDTTECEKRFKLRLDTTGEPDLYAD